MKLKDLKTHFGSISDAAKAAGISTSYVYRLGCPVKKPWNAYFELLSGGAIKANIKKYKK
jgi:hypothetical protein